MSGSISQLTQGAVRSMMVGDEVEKPILQVLGQKKINSTGTGSDRYRLLLSDGVHTHSSTMLATQLNHLVTNNKLETFTIVRLDKYICNVIQPDRRVVIVLEVEILTPGSGVGGRIGNPAPFKLTDATNGTPAPPPQNKPAEPQINGSHQQTSPPASKGGFYGNNVSTLQRGATNLPATPGGTVPKVFPISSLTPYQNRWTIQARVTSKSNIRTWSNSRGEGKLFSMNLLDKSGEIKATAFKEQCDQFFEAVEVNKVYYITKGTLKAANKQYSTIDNEYEMTFNNDTKMVPCEDEAEVPNVTFNFVPINKLADFQANTVIDVIGVVKEMHDIVDLTSKAGKALRKRDIQIADQSLVICRMTLWGTDAEQFDGSKHPIIAVKGARVSEWGGRTLSVGGDCQLVLDPDLPEAHSLRGWYDSVGSTSNFEEYKSEGGSFSSGGQSNWKTFFEAKNEHLGVEKTDYFSAKGIITHIKKDNLVYKACPSQDCNKKLIDLSSGMFRCEKCSKEYPGTDFKYRLIIQLCLADHTENLWTSCFQDTGEMILKEKASEIGRLIAADDPHFDDLLTEAVFKPYNFRMRVKIETYNDEHRLKAVCLSANPINYVEYNKKLIEDIEKLAGLTV